jgi:hypothetical protein
VGLKAQAPSEEPTFEFFNKLLASFYCRKLILRDVLALGS